MEATWLDKTPWMLFVAQTRKRAVASIACGCIFVGFSLTGYLYYLYAQGPGPIPRPYPLFLFLISAVALAQILAGFSRLLYENRRMLARVLGVASIALLAAFWTFILVGVIYVL